MEPEHPAKPLSDETWFIAFLAAKGFTQSGPNTFTNGKATVEVDGYNVSAHPGSGDKSWNAKFPPDKESVKLLLSEILKMRPFLTDADLAKERVEKDRLEKALTGIANTIKENPDTHSGNQLRRFLWSLYNGEHLINLYRMTSILDGRRGAWVAEVVAGAFVGGLQEGDIKRALLVAGEMKRWDEEKPTSEQKERIEEAERQIESLLKSMPPSFTHVELKRAREALLAVKDALQRAKEGQEQQE